MGCESRPPPIQSVLCLKRHAGHQASSTRPLDDEQKRDAVIARFRLPGGLTQTVIDQVRNLVMCRPMLSHAEIAACGKPRLSRPADSHAVSHRWKVLPILGALRNSRL
jgi:hypothetical protein